MYLCNTAMLMRYLQSFIEAADMQIEAVERLLANFYKPAGAAADAKAAERAEMFSQREQVQISSFEFIVQF